VTIISETLFAVCVAVTRETIFDVFDGQLSRRQMPATVEEEETKTWPLFCTTCLLVSIEEELFMARSPYKATATKTIRMMVVVVVDDDDDTGGGGGSGDG
jgi:hypothetical protein